MEEKISIKTSYKDFKLNKQYDSVLIITDEHVRKYQSNKLDKYIKHNMVFEYVVPSGEESKSFETYERIMEYCIKLNLSRKSLIIALGGGVVGDLAGFVASTYMRGIDVIQVPTTLLAQVDSSIGGKTGINIGNYKNIVGSFYQPTHIYINVNSLETLDNDEFIGGMSEVIKYALVYDYEFLDYLIDNYEGILDMDEEKLLYIVDKCANIKLDIVEKDEREGGLRKILNLGHTFGHGIEKLGNMSHGFAVSIGTVVAFKLSLDKGYITQEYYNKIKQVFELYKLPTEFYDIEPKDIFEIMKKDKKNSFSKINLVLPTDYGKVDVFDDINDNEILSVIEGAKHA